MLKLLRWLPLAFVAVIVLSGAVTASANTSGAVQCIVTNNVGPIYLCGDPLPIPGSAGVLTADTPNITCGLITNVGAPSISGTPQPGNTLSASPGSWQDACYQIVSFAYQWSNGAGGPSYTVQDGDVGQTLSVTVTACDTEGNCASASSDGVTIQPGPPPPPPPNPTTIDSFSANPA